MKTTNWILTTAVVSVAALAAVASHAATHAQQEDLAMPSTDSVTDDATFAALAELPDEEPLIMLNLLE
ncbi:MAG: hypothetical protein O7F71_17380, partial [Gammaproteobacteria bacterium]|nr:hypothetical protein [Gammaproteobacteria bacterium]